MATTGCLSPSEAPVGRGVRQLASRAALDACCISLVAFAGDKRGRMREFSLELLIASLRQWTLLRLNSLQDRLRGVMR